MSLQNQNKQALLELRTKAEMVISRIQTSQHIFDGQNLEALVQELQVYQIELEMQIDELRIANEHLEQQHTKFESLYDLAPIGYIILNEEGYIQDINNACSILFEVKKNRIINTPLHQFIANEDSDNFHRFKQQLLKTKQKQTCQIKMVSKIGKEFCAQVEGIAINQPGHPIQCYLAIIDVTDRIQAQHTVNDHKERLELALEAAAAGTWELDLDTMEFYLDDFNFKVCNLPNSGFDGQYQSFINLLHRDDQYNVDQHFRAAFNSGDEIDVECRVIDKTGDVCYADIRGHIINTPGKGKRFVGIMMNISAKKQAEKKTERLKMHHRANIITATLKAGESERHRISSSLHDGVSQLLYGIKMKAETIDETNYRETVNSISQFVDMAVKDIRNISFELSPSILATFGLIPTIKELASRFSTPRMKIVANVKGFNERLNFDLETTVFRIVQELVNNCMKYSMATLIQIDLIKDKQLKICVKDNGIGFDVGKQQAITTGSGLISIRNRISIYGGTISIVSVPNETKVDIVMSLTPVRLSQSNESFI